MPETQKLHTFVLYVENHPGVLNRVASLFRRRAYNIESLTVGHTERPGSFAHDDRRRNQRGRGPARRGESLQARPGSLGRRRYA